MTENHPPNRKQGRYSWLTVEDARFYGVDMDPLERNEMRQIKIPPESIFHVGRHLRKLSLKSRKKLLDLQDKSLSEDAKNQFIENMLQTTGSKFNTRVQDPETLIRFALD